MKNITILFATIAFLLSANGSFATDVNCENKVNVDVNGMVCDFCARAIEKVFSKKEEVSSIDVNLDEGKIIITMKDSQVIDNTTLTKLITDSGYDVVKINKGCALQRQAHPRVEVCAPDWDEGMDELHSQAGGRHGQVELHRRLLQWQ